MAYVFMSASNAGSSVQDKVLNQIKALNAIGRDCKGLFFSTDELHNLPAYILPIKVNKTNAKWFVKTQQRHAYFKALWMSLDLLNKYDIVYVRYPGANKLLLKTLKALHSKLIFIEHITAEIPELKLSHNKAIKSISDIFRKIEFYIWPWLQEKWYGKRIRQTVRFGLCNSEDIVKYQQQILPNYRLYIVGDGIDTDSVVVRDNPKLDKVFKMVFLKGANGQAEYNGLDRLMKGMKAYKGHYSLELHIYGKDLHYEADLANTIGINESVFCWPYQSAASLTKLLNQFHIGIGALAIHRKGLKSTTTIKNREYCKYRIPFIFAHYDIDFFESEYNFFKQIPSDESSIELQEIIEWYNQIDIKELSNQFNSIIEDKLSFKIKMKYLNQLISKT